METAAKAAGKTVEFMVYADSPHAWRPVSRAKARQIVGASHTPLSKFDKPLLTIDKGRAIVAE